MDENTIEVEDSRHRWDEEGIGRYGHSGDAPRDLRTSDDTAESRVVVTVRRTSDDATSPFERLLTEYIALRERRHRQDCGKKPKPLPKLSVENMGGWMREQAYRLRHGQMPESAVLTIRSVCPELYDLAMGSAPLATQRQMREAA